MDFPMTPKAQGMMFSQPAGIENQPENHERTSASTDGSMLYGGSHIKDSEANFKSPHDSSIEAGYGPPIPPHAVGNIQSSAVAQGKRVRNHTYPTIATPPHQLSVPRRVATIPADFQIQKPPCLFQRVAYCPRQV